MPVPTDIQNPAAHVAQVIVGSRDWAAADQRPAPPLPKPSAKRERKPPPVALTDKRVRDAVAETLAESPSRADLAPNQQEGLHPMTLSAGENYETFAKRFTYAKVPYCLGDNGLKFQPPVIGFIGFTGLLAIPWVMVAKARGKCK